MIIFTKQVLSAQRRRRRWDCSGSFVTSEQLRSLATVYGVGEGWTGALGTGRLDERVIGHFDEDEGSEHSHGVLPTKMFEGDVLSCSLGWGHTALITSAASSRGCHDQILITGRPHEFSSLLRLHRLPKMLRDYSVRQTIINTSSEIEDTKSNLNPVTLMGRFVTMLSEAWAPDVEDWENARRQSGMIEFTPMDLFPAINPNADEKTHEEIPIEIACSAGFSAVRTQTGSIHTFGLNGYGQCGTGYACNNVWKPEIVPGLSSESARGTRSESEEFFPITKISLGLQRTFSLVVKTDSPKPSPRKSSL
jgi:Regulator of chromosome condensation (RCC1) repeat